MNDSRRIAEEQAKARADTDQRRAADPTISAWTSASAGTGKTKVLVDRVLRLLLDGAAPHRILCITYTKAAAAEMANRINLELAKWSTADDETLAGLLRELTGAAVGTDRFDRARRLFAHVLEAPGGLQIHTIHAFSQTVLKRFPIEAGLAPHFAVIDERDAAAAIADARRATIEAARDNPGGDLDAALATIAEFAGEESFAALLDALVMRPERLRDALAGGFAALKTRLYGALGLAPGETEASAIAAACAADKSRDGRLRLAAEAMLANGGSRDGENGRRIADWLAAPSRTEHFAEYLRAFFTDGGDGARRKDLLSKKAAALAPGAAAAMADEAERLDAVRQRCKVARTAAATAALFCLGGAVLTYYSHYKQARAALDFADLIERARALLGRGRAAWVLWKLDGGIDHVLVDEAQDTSSEQWELIRLLVDEFFAGAGAEHAHLPGGGRTLFVVGDFKQSIFSFQGAAPAEFRATHGYFRKRAEDARLGWADVPLIVSFRSTGAVLAAVDKVFALADARAGVADEPEPIEHLTARGGLAGLVEVWPTVKPRDGGAEVPWEEAVPERAVPEPHAVLANEVAKRIDDWIRRKEILESLGRPIHAGDVMILVRRRGAFMDAMVSALKNRGVRVTGIDRMRLSEQLAVQDMISLGRFLLLPEDDFTLANVLKGPLFGFDDDRHLFPLAHGRGKQTLWRRLGELAAANSDFAAARRRLEELLARADFTPPYELFARVLEAEGGRRATLARLGPDAEDPLDEFLELALDYQRRHAPSLEGFLHWLGQGETEIKRDLDQGGRDEVRVMTVHGAKGLQAPIVFLADTVAVPQDDERILWPAPGADEVLAATPLFAPVRADEIPEAVRRRAAMQQRTMEEYRRLLYVALTRAADRLYVCGYETTRGAPDTCWHALVAKAFAAEPQADFRFGEHWSGKGWRIERHGRPETPAAPPLGRRDETVEIPEWAVRAPVREAPPPRPLAPSRPAEDEPPVRSPFADEKHFRRGRLVHRLLQTLPDLSPAARREAARRYLARPGHGLAPSEIDALANETLALFDDPACAALFAPGSLAEVPLTGVLGAHVVSGQVDRLAIGATEILVVDYKTNRAPPPLPPALYVKQMAAYRALLRRIYPGRAVRCFLLWTTGPALAELDEAALDAATPGAAAPVPASA
ncbi:MAG TPA: double-strand break repair helicase AddA [Alphaproteobacteria bacterium]|jgi:ATP-dependent helicase/nuclease subunit A